MAYFGMRTFNELIGRVDLLECFQNITHWKAKYLDFSKIFYRPITTMPYFHTETQNHNLYKSLNNKLIQYSKIALEKGEKVF